MSYGLTLYTAATEEPVSILEARAQCSVTGMEHHDARLNSLNSAARKWAEDYTNRQFCTATWDLQIDRFPYGYGKIYIPRAPLRSITSITYLESAAGASTTLSSSDYRVLTSREPGEVTAAFGVALPSVYPVNGTVTIRFSAGYGAASAVPSQIKDAIKLKLEQLFRISVGEDANGFEETAMSLLESCRVGDEFHQYAECA